MNTLETSRYLPGGSEKKYNLDSLPEEAHKDIAYALQYGIDDLLGDILTIIDTLNFPHAQDKAVKDLIKKAYYQRYNITGERLMRVVFKLQETCTPNNASAFTVFGQNAEITGLSLPVVDDNS